jgi:hypothetical protein
MYDCHDHFVDSLKFFDCIHVDNLKCERCITGSHFEQHNFEANFCIFNFELECESESPDVECSNNNFTDQ